MMHLNKERALQLRKERISSNKIINAYVYAVDSGNDNCYGAISHKLSSVKMQDRS